MRKIIEATHLPTGKKVTIVSVLIEYLVVHEDGKREWIKENELSKLPPKKERKIGFDVK